MELKAAVMMGAQSANMKKRWFGISVHSCVITDNPYDRKHHKKQHVAWHNAFYETRKNSDYNRLL